MTFSRISTDRSRGPLWREYNSPARCLILGLTPSQIAEAVLAFTALGADLVT